VCVYFLVVLEQLCFVGKLFFLFTKKKFSTDNTFLFELTEVVWFFCLFSDLFFKENKMKIKNLFKIAQEKLMKFHHFDKNLSKKTIEMLLKTSVGVFYLRKIFIQL